MSQPSSSCVVSISLLPTGEDSVYAAWEAEVEAAAATLPGFLEAERFAPVPGLQDRRVLILRFDGQPGLAAWMKSQKRAELLEKASAFEPNELAVAGLSSVKKPVTVLVNTKVKPEDVPAFKAFQAEIAEKQRSFPGYIDGKILAPVAGVSDVWTITMRFDTDEHVDNWLHSKERRELMDKVDAPLRGDAPRKIVADLGGWFQVKSTEEPPSNWKQAMCVMLALYPSVIGLTKLDLPGRVWHGIPFALDIFLNNVLSMILLTWVLMPRLTGFLSYWLQPPMDQPRSTETKATIAVLGILLIEVLIFLKTT